MSKITFRADDDLVRRLEAFDASKSEVMREALRAYLDERGAVASAGGDPADRSTPDGSVDEVIADRVDEILGERLADLDRRRQREARDVNVNITLEGTSGEISTDAGGGSAAPASAGDDPTGEASTGSDPEVADGPPAAADDEPDECVQCGEELSPSAVYCPNCGEKASQRAFCECGDEIRTDWAFCPSCGRRTPAANVLGDS